MLEFTIYTSADSPGFAALYGLFRNSFPDPDEAEEFDDIVLSFLLPGKKELTRRYGEFHEYWIAAKENGRLLGGVNVSVFRASCSAHVNYVFTSKDCRRRGVGSALLEKAAEISGVDWLFCEQNDPGLMSSGELESDFAAAGISCDERIAWWRHRGFRKLGMRYVQPPLSPEKEPVTHMSLNVCVDADAVSVAGTVVAEHLRRFYYIAVLKGRADWHPFVESLLSYVRSRFEIPLETVQ